MFRLALALAFFPPVAPASANDNWPQWRGPSGDSVVRGTALPTRWSKDQNVLWKVSLPGWATSTPAIWNDAVFVTSQDGERLLLLRLDRASGKVVWQREVSRGTPIYDGRPGPGHFHKEHNMASPSPVTDGTHVWAHFGNGVLACYDFAGEKVWTTDLMKHYGRFTIWWGHANSPVLAGDVLVAVCMQEPKGGGRSYVVGLDKRTGKERWHTPRDTGAKSEPADSYTTPLLRRVGTRDEVVVFGGNVLDAYDPTTGKRLWKSDVFKGNRVISGPTLTGGTVLAIQGMRGPLFAIAAPMKDGAEPRVLWKYTGATPDAACPAATGGLVFLATNDGVAICLDGATGKQLWKERLAVGFRASPLVSDGKVYFLGTDGKTALVKAARTFELMAESDLGEPIIASPAAAGGQLFIRTRGHLYCFGAAGKAG